MATTDKYNLKNPAVKRILMEVKEMQSNPSDDFMSLPLEENIFEWQFAIRGPQDTEFEGGIYHGRIQLPSEYPFKPPSFMLLTPNGRFETQTKICLSISNHHPEHWQPSWSVRTALVALIAFMPTAPNGALGSLDYKKEERRELAIKSREASPKFGTPDRQKVIDEIHEYMLSKAPPVPENLKQASEENPGEKEAEAEGSENAGRSANSVDPANAGGERAVEEPQAAVDNANAVDQREAVPRQVRAGIPNQQLQHRPAPRNQRPSDDRFLTWAAVGLAVAIVFLVLKKLVKSSGYDAIFLSES
ncbi:ubiquitin-conjugating enzyme E2 32-like [Chenopodium quinoa]|uniref:ubiquitin-conjugating enzyme E2 32-like n=1 Tax=Chenopodium quinoa TaxID=63459 RepID=UPI000B7878C6|nr:ubiquitin-conjugating enzyme E2 32-like [Chenopodium quinoa]